jgi:hypothetical protein
MIAGATVAHGSAVVPCQKQARFCVRSVRAARTLAETDGNARSVLSLPSFMDVNPFMDSLGHFVLDAVGIRLRRPVDESVEIERPVRAFDPQVV